MRYYVSTPFGFNDDYYPTYVAHDDPHMHFVSEMQLGKSWANDAEEYAVARHNSGNLDNEYAYYGGVEPDGWWYDP